MFNVLTCILPGFLWWSSMLCLVDSEWDKILIRLVIPDKRAHINVVSCLIQKNKFDEGVVP